MLHVDISHQDYDSALGKLNEISPDKNQIDIVVDFGADHSQSKIIRDYIGGIFDYHHVVGPWRGRFILITDELINNAIEHGSSEGDIDCVVIKAGKGEDGAFSITLEVHDTGNGKDAIPVVDMEKMRTETNTSEGPYMELRGRGLFRITEKLVDRLEFRESPKGGLAVRIEKVIPDAIVK